MVKKYWRSLSWRSRRLWRLLERGTARRKTLHSTHNWTGLPARSGRRVSEGWNPYWESQHATFPLREEWPTSHTASVHLDQYLYQLFLSRKSEGSDMIRDVKLQACEQKLQSVPTALTCVGSHFSEKMCSAGEEQKRNSQSTDFHRN